MRGVATPSFVVELPLRVSALGARTLEVRFEAARQIYNATLGEGLRRLKLLREGRDWQRAVAMARGKERSGRLRELSRVAGFDGPSLETFATQTKNAAFQDRLGSDDTQKIALRAFAAVQEYAFGKRGRPRFKGFRRGLRTIEGKKNAVISFDGSTVIWNGRGMDALRLPAIIDRNDAWLMRALEHRLKYCRLVRRCVRGRERWSVQLIMDGISPPKPRHENKPRCSGTVGLDIGPSTIAVVGEKEARFERLCPSIEQPWRSLRRIERAMDRSRRATNSGNYNADGTVKKGPKKWVRSLGYRRLAATRAEIERRLAAERKRSHGQLSNEIMTMGHTVRTEKLSYRSFQKMFGRSVKVRSPGLLLSILRRKAESTGGTIEEFPTRTTRLSQLCHGCGQLKKKPLSLRIHECECGVGPVHRDLYSAYLACFVRQGELDVRQAEMAWPARRHSLGQATSSAIPSCEREGSAKPHGGNAVRATRLPEGDRPKSRPRMSYRHVREGRGEVLAVSPETPAL